MEVPTTMDALAWLRKHLDEDGTDLLREMVRVFAERLMAAEVDAICNAGYGEVTPDRVNSRNGLRHRDFDTRVGTIDLAIPKLRQRQLLPGLAAGAPATGRAGAHPGGRPSATCAGCPPAASRGWSRPSASST